MRCDNCFHKEVCVHLTNIKNDTYARVGYKFNADECKDYVDNKNIAMIIHAHKGLSVSMRSCCSNCGHLAYCENYCSNCGAIIDSKS